MKDAKDRRIAELEKQVLALNTLIDIAEADVQRLRKYLKAYRELAEV